MGCRVAGFGRLDSIIIGWRFVSSVSLFFFTASMLSESMLHLSHNAYALCGLFLVSLSCLVFFITDSPMPLLYDILFHRFLGISFVRITSLSAYAVVLCTSISVIAILHFFVNRAKTWHTSLTTYCSPSRRVAPCRFVAYWFPHQKRCCLRGKRIRVEG